MKTIYQIKSYILGSSYIVGEYTNLEDAEACLEVAKKANKSARLTKLVIK